MSKLQFIIMILKIVKRNLGQIQYNIIIRNSSYLFCNKNQKDGFSKFKRVKRNQPNTKNQKQESLSKKNQKDQDDIIKSKQQQSNEQNITKNNTQPKKDQIHGFSNFSRKKQQVKIQQKINNLSKQQFKRQQDKKQSLKQENFNIKKQQSTNFSQGFQNFKRKKQQNLKDQIKITKQQENKKQSINKTNTQEIKTQIKKQQAANNKKNNQQIGVGFSKFASRNRSNQTQNSKRNQNQKDNKQKSINNQQKPQAKKQPLAGFSKFSRTYNENNEKQSKNNQSMEQQSHQIHKSEKVEQKKSQQQIQKQMMSKKQEQFRVKINHFKNLKMKGQQQNLIKRKLEEFGKTFSKEFEKKTGFNFNFASNTQTPDFIKNIPILAFLYTRRIPILLLLAGFLIWQTLTQMKTEQISVEQFLQKLQKGEVYRIIFEKKQIQTQTQIGKKSRTNVIIQVKSGQRYFCVSNAQFENMIKIKVGLLNSLSPSTLPIIIQHRKKEYLNWLATTRNLLSFVMLFFFIRSLSGGSSKKMGQKGGQMGGLFQQSKSKRFQQVVNVKFNDVVGMQKAKQQIVQFIDFLKNPQKYHKLGARIPRGALLTGPPGTGKTMIAKACAGESKVPFFTISGSQFMQMYVGVGAQRVRDLFKQAKQAAPSIIFIDQIDAVGKKRAAGFGGGNDERDNTLNQLLVQMDGFNTESNVIVFAATNQKDVLDTALTRPGRFDRLIQVDLPDIEGRKQIFMVHLRPIVIDSESSIEEYARRMATLTPGFSGADIKNLCNEAAIMAARHDSKFVSIHDFQLATQRVIGGVQKKSHLITQQTRKIVAYHQCGHGVVSWFLQGSNPLLKLTIIPRSKGSLGFAQYLPHESQISTKKQLQDQICVILAGRVTEQIFFSKISTGAYDDLQKAYSIAKMIVTQYGMSQKLGWLSFEESQYAKHYSKQTQKKIDQQIINIIKNCTDRTRKLVMQKRELIEKLASKLLEVQTIDLSIISDLLGERPFKPNKQYQEYLKERKKMIEGKEKENKNEDSNKGSGQQLVAIRKQKLVDFII